MLSLRHRTMEVGGSEVLSQTSDDGGRRVGGSLSNIGRWRSEGRRFSLRHRTMEVRGSEVLSQTSDDGGQRVERSLSDIG
jgi:hypothetical protein